MSPEKVQQSSQRYGNKAFNLLLRGHSVSPQINRHILQEAHPDTKVTQRFHASFHAYSHTNAYSIINCVLSLFYINGIKGSLHGRVVLFPQQNEGVSQYFSTEKESKSLSYRYSVKLSLLLY